MASLRSRKTDPDRIGNLIADGDRLWSVTPERVALWVVR